MVVGTERAVGPPSTMRGIWSPSWARTKWASVHSGMPRRLAEVAVMGTPRPETTARAMAASGTRRATLPVLAVTRSGQAGAGLDDDGEGAGPEALGEAVEGGVDVAGEAIGLGGFGDEQRERLVAGAGLDLVDAIDGGEIDGVDGESVEGVGGQRADVASGETLDYVGDEVRFGFGGVDAECLGRQNFLLCGWNGGQRCEGAMRLGNRTIPQP